MYDKLLDFRKSDLSGFLILIAALFTILPFLIHEIYSYDIWWHIAIGTDILQSGHVPAVDMYSAAGSGRPYHDSHWLFQVIVALSHTVLGMVGVQVVMIIIWGTVLLFCYMAIRKWVSISLASFLLFVVAMSSVERFLPRPEIITFLGITTFYWLLQKNRYNSWKDQALFGLLQVVWVNSHGLFIIGIFMVGCYWLFALLEHLRGQTLSLKPLSSLLIVVVACSFLSPHGIYVWQYALLLFKEVGSQGPIVMKGLGELSPTFGESARAGIAFWFYLILLLAAVCSGLIAGFRERRISPRTLILAALFLASLTGRRNIVLFSIVSAPFIAESLSFLIPRNWRFRDSWAVSVACIILVGSWFPLSGKYYTMMKYPSRTGFGVTPSFFPLDLPSFLNSINFKGQVLNSNILGGFYLYQFFPEAVPLTDGRWEIYGQDELELIHSSSTSRDHWRLLIERYDIKGILLAHASPEAKAMLPALGKSSDWRLVYLDQVASFWMPSGKAGTPPTVDLSMPSNIPFSFRVDDSFNLASFFALTSMKEPLAVHLERSLYFGQQTEWFLERLGKVNVELERWDDARDNYEELYRLDKTNAGALNELAFLAYLRGDLSEALRLIKKALEIEPDNKDFQVNYQRVKQAMQAQRISHPLKDQ